MYITWVTLQTHGDPHYNGHPTRVGSAGKVEGQEKKEARESYIWKYPSSSLHSDLTYNNS